MSGHASWWGEGKYQQDVGLPFSFTVGFGEISLSAMKYITHPLLCDSVDYSPSPDTKWGVSQMGLTWHMKTQIIVVYDAMIGHFEYSVNELI